MNRFARAGADGAAGADLASRHHVSQAKEVLVMEPFSIPGLPRRVAAGTLVLAPALALASAFVAPALHGDEGEQLAVIAAHPDRWYWYTLLLLAGSVLLVPAVFAVAALVATRMPRLGAI